MAWRCDEEVIDNGDGTGTHYVYSSTGDVVSQEIVPIPPEPIPSPEPIDPVVVTEFASGIIGADNMQQMKDAAQALLDALGGA
jgi:hypothetical protein